MVASAASFADVPMTMYRPVSRWKASPALVGAPAYLRPWLSDPASLTARIVARCKKFRVRVLNEAFTRPFVDERMLIGLGYGRHAWTREVLLIADDEPVVFAHSVMAPRDLTGAWHMARAIGSQPLGAALFADPAIQRGALQCTRLHVADPLHRHAETAVGEALPILWGRRSRFSRLMRPLVVTEVFLPGIAKL